jgi:hypothetical protein
MGDIRVGEILPGPAPRDAIHVPAAVFQTAEVMKAGDKVVFVGNKIKKAGAFSPCLGHVDVWIEGTIPEGSWVVVIFKPGTARKVKHTWSHPAVPHDGEMPREWTREDLDRVSSALQGVDDMCCPDEGEMQEALAYLNGKK